MKKPGSIAFPRRTPARSQPRGSDAAPARPAAEFLTEKVEGHSACPCGGGCPRCAGAFRLATADFSDVRLHPSAPEVTTRLRARAVTIGQDVYFHPGQFQPGTPEGKTLIAHELAHTLQTRSPASAASRSAADVSRPGDALEKNADALARGETARALAAPAGIALRAPFVIEHSSGSTYEVPGMTDAETEFGASGSSSSLLTPAKPRAGRPITGGFKTGLDVDIGYATGVDTVASKDVDALIKSAGKKIDPKLLPVIRHVATDKFVFNALDSFLNKDGGKIEAWNNNSGHYDGDNSPPTLSIGIATGEEDLRATFVHELLHYVFDKSDSVLAESKSSGGADHPAIEAIEARYVIVDLIRSGKSPLDKKIEDDFGRFLKGDDYFTKMQDAIAKDDRSGLKALVAQSDFVKKTVSTGLLGEASSLNFKTTTPEYHYTADQFRDLGFIWAQNAAIVRHAMKTAAAVADKTKTPLKDVFATAAWQKEMSTFLDAFVKGLRKDRTKGVVSLEAKL